MAWRRSLRAAHRTVGGLRARTIALIVSVPLALGALEFPTEAMHLAVTRLPVPDFQSAPSTIADAAQGAETTLSELPIFTTEMVRQQFLDPVEQSYSMSLDTIKEHFFRTQVPYGSIIYREARRNNLPPELVAAVVAAESDFRPRLISHKNAQGLMQIIPSTAEFIGAGDLFNPADNIAAGTKYLRYLYNRFDGDHRMVLAAYNAGEGNVEKFGGIPPFQETINVLVPGPHDPNPETAVFTGGSSDATWRVTVDFDQRIAEATKLGFSRIFIPKGTKGLSPTKAIELVQVGRVDEVLHALFG